MEETITIEAEPSSAWRVRENLWIGNAPPTKEALRAAGFDCVVLMAQEYQPTNCFFGVDTVHAPIDDAQLNRVEAQLAMGAARDVIVKLRQGRRVLVTCMAGLNRSGLVCALALVFGNGMAPDDAVALLRAVRGPGALSNPHFVEFVRRIAK